jgi:hypothetical protein
VGAGWEWAVAATSAGMRARWLKRRSSGIDAIGDFNGGSRDDEICDISKYTFQRFWWEQSDRPRDPVEAASKSGDAYFAEGLVIR